MMSVLEYRFGARRTVLALTSLLIAACASILGIEDRKLDEASSYPLGGYDGCRPGVTCDDCLDVHRAVCDAASFCADTSGLGACGSCVCENCGEVVAECRTEPECAAIWQCLQQSRCDLADGVSGSCREACGGVIEQNGGLSGRPFRDAAAIRTCAITESCLSCLPAQRDLPPPGCTPDNNCVGCDDCFQQCLCSGEMFGACQTLCDDAPPACSGADDCAGCTSCFQVCACQGGGFGECTGECQIDDPPECTLAESCAGCASCVAQCECEGGEETACHEACEPPPVDDVCSESSSGPGSAACGGCTSCFAQCSCDGIPVEECVQECEMDSCCEGGDCSGFYGDCLCPSGVSSEQCAQQYYDCSPASGCDECTCESCTDLFVMCHETSECPSLFECMRATGCEGSACAERCADSRQQTTDDFAIAEALWACDQGAGCRCDGQGPVTVVCGGVQCNSYETNDVKFEACCPGASSEGEPAGQAPGDLASCGLDLQRHFEDAPECIPMNQPNPPPILGGLLLRCDQGRVQKPPYNNAVMKGCCRDDGICGFWDDITGLGCMDPRVFGAASATPCN